MRSWLALIALTFSTSAIASPPNEPAPDHVLKVEALPDGQAQKLSVVIQPNAPWKWNAEYPAKLEFELPAGVSAKKGTLKMVDGDFELEGKGARAATGLSAATPGAYLARVKGRFGLCDANVCVIKKVDTTATLQVK